MNAVMNLCVCNPLSAFSTIASKEMLQLILRLLMRKLIKDIYLNQRMMNVQTWHEFSMFSYSYAQRFNNTVLA